MPRQSQQQHSSAPPVEGSPRVASTITTLVKGLARHTARPHSVQCVHRGLPGTDRSSFPDHVPLRLCVAPAGLEGAVSHQPHRYESTRHTGRSARAVITFKGSVAEAINDARRPVLLLHYKLICSLYTLKDIGFTFVCE